MVLAGKLRRKIIERVSGVSGARQKDERPATSSPIKHFKLNTFLDGDKLNFVRRGIRLGLRWQRNRVRCDQEKI
jgi:hypothetical protein